MPPYLTSAVQPDPPDETNHSMTASTARPKNTRVTPQRKLDLDHKPQRNPDSVPAHLEALAVDESYTKGTRIPLDDFTLSAANDWFTKVTRTLSVQVARTKEANPLREYTIERVSGTASSTSYLLCALLVTRTK